MNFRQLEYAVQLAEVCNFSQSAEKLNISQPALSKQIKSLEDELGVRLFNRDTVPLTLTPAGEYFVQEVKEILYRESQLVRSMDKFKTEEAGRLSIGISPFRSLYLISNIIRKVNEKYPDVQITLNELGSDELKKEATEGKFDFAIVNLPVDETQLDIIPIKPEEIVLAVPTQMLDRINESKSGISGPIDFKDCGKLPFVTLTSSQEIRKTFDNLCIRAGIQPRIVAEVVGLVTARTLVNEGIGAALFPMQFVDSESLEERVSLIRLKDRADTRQPVIVTKKNQYLSKPAQYAISLLSKQ